MGYSMYTTKKAATDKANLLHGAQLMLKNLEPLKGDYEVYNIKRFGRLMEGEAYYHEVDEYYRCVGFEVEIESQFAFGEGDSKKLGDLQTQVGFYSTWVGKSHEAAPFTFEESYREIGTAHRFDNGLGDHVSVVKVIATQKEVDDALKSLAIS